ncbi:MAG TPA: hypothetical protein VGW76_09710 [Pyrinomonadaceae bacterium]|nr:hypothetical protein [Pyrinomonadaceae bacterium]
MSLRLVHLTLPACVATLLLSGVCGVTYSSPPLYSLAYSTKITEANWRSHPKIKAIDQVVKSIDLGLKKRVFKSYSRSLDCGDWSEVKRIARNSNGIGRWYEDYSEGQDSSTNLRYYYDDAGQLRFVLAFARSANGTREQLRLYFDKSGKRIWQNHIVKGLGCPGCFSAYLDSDNAIAFKANKAFAANEGCKPIKP